MGLRASGIQYRQKDHMSEQNVAELHPTTYWHEAYLQSARSLYTWPKVFGKAEVSKDGSDRGNWLPPSTFPLRPQLLKAGGDWLPDS